MTSGEIKPRRRFKLPPGLRKAGRALARFRGWVPITNLGFVVLGVSSVVLFKFAQPRVDYVLQLVSALALLLVTVAVLVVVPATWAVHRALKRLASAGGLRDVFEAQRGFATLLRMPSFRYFPLIDLEWTWLEPEGFKVELVKEGRTIVERVEATERAHAERVVRRFVIEDAFGLARLVLHRSEARVVRALPWTGRLAVAPMLRSHTGGEDIPHPLGELEGDRVDMRPYVPGDPLRLALWKVYARTRELMVRTPERAISPSLRIIAYLPSARADDPAAAAARVAIDHGLLGDGWSFGADGGHAAAKDRDEAMELITRSRSFRDAPEGDGAGLGRFLEAEGDLKNRLILFVPAIPGPWMTRALEALKRRQGPVTALIATDGLRDKAPKERFDRWLRLPAPPESTAFTDSESLMFVAQTMASAGATVVAVERPTGRMLSLGIRQTKRVA